MEFEEGSDGGSDGGESLVRMRSLMDDDLEELKGGLLSLYEASYIEKEGEAVLKEAMDFATEQLKEFMEEGSVPEAGDLRDQMGLNCQGQASRVHETMFLCTLQHGARRRLLGDEGERLGHCAWLKERMGKLCKAYFEEAKWFHHGQTPKLQEYLENGWVSISNPIMLFNAYCMGKDLTGEALMCCIHFFLSLNLFVAFSKSDPLRSDVEMNIMLESSLNAKEKIISELNMELHNMESTLLKGREQHLNEIKKLNALINEKDSALLEIRRELQERPTTRLVDDLRKKVKILQVEFEGLGELRSKDEEDEGI
ncbi:hypothetical protein ZIOFF_059439 [Zingiber officinale]|uniref:Terpene synthase metal-binding domain-containing protein n=1 Tax=Zingiber officinale TaxID=94328 RepID=A0A8J5F9J5_ZINOF|nr:hypothetical protein ZIOFF_059439 [Zingiber officinale]